MNAITTSERRKNWHHWKSKFFLLLTIVVRLEKRGTGKRGSMQKKRILFFNICMKDHSKKPAENHV